MAFICVCASLHKVNKSCREQEKLKANFGLMELFGFESD